VLHLRYSDFPLDQGKRPAIRRTSKRTTPQDTTSNQTQFKNITHNETLEIFWLQQDEDSHEFIRSLQHMKNKINKIRVNQMVQTDIRKFFNRS
jgi:hypothetical protein